MLYVTGPLRMPSALLGSTTHAASPRVRSGAHMVETLALRNFSVQRGTRTVLYSVDSLAFHLGESVCVIGPNGSGKSTLLEALALGGMRNGAQGEVLLEGQATWKPEERARKLAYLPQRIDVPLGFTVEEVVRFGLTPHQDTPSFSAAEADTATRQALTFWGLDAWRTRNVEDLSGGEQKRVHLARIDVQNTQVTVLDEPSAALDLRIAKQLYEHLAPKPHRLTIYASHDLVLGTRLATRVILLSAGRIVADGPWTKVHSAFEQAFGVPFDILRTDARVPP